MSEIPITPVSEITRDRMDWRIKVRVCRKWKVKPKGKILESLEFLFIDMQGSRVHASVKKIHISKYENQVSEGDVCYVHQFSVVNSPQAFPVTDFAYRIMFHASTLIKKVEDPLFQVSTYNFLNFQDVRDGFMKPTGPVFDVIGRVVDMNEDRMKNDGSVKGSKSVTVLIEDLNKIRISCLLWDPFCYELKNFLELVRGGDVHQVIIVQLCRAKEFTDSIGVSNTFDATKLIIDQNNDEIREFKTKLKSTVVSSSFDGSQISCSSYISVKGDIESSNSVFYTVQELKDATKPCKVWIVGSISEIRTNGGWSYISCTICKKKVEEQEEQFWCSVCNKFVIAEERFRVTLSVVDGTSNAPFMLWDETAKSMIGKSVTDVWDIFFQEHGDIDKTDKEAVAELAKLRSPWPIENMIGKEYIFKVTITERHIQKSEKIYIVERYSEDQELIKKHKKSNHDLTDTSTSPMKDVNYVSVSVQEENDSQSISDMKTPEFPKSGKRNLDRELDEAEEHSSTKAPKSE